MLLESAGKRIGSFSVNTYRLIITVDFLTTSHSVFLGAPLPVGTHEQWFRMGLSGIVGLGIGAFGLFWVFVIISHGLSLIAMNLPPTSASAFAYMMPGEIIQPLGFAGIIITPSCVVQSH